MSLAEVIVSLVVPCFTLVVGWLAGKKNADLAALEKEMNFYRTLVTDLKNEIQELRKDIIELEDSNQALIRDNHLLRGEIDTLRQQLRKQKTSNDV